MPGIRSAGPLRAHDRLVATTIRAMRLSDGVGGINVATGDCATWWDIAGLEHDVVMINSVAVDSPRAVSFRPELSRDALADLVRRLDAARLPAHGDTTWERGVPGNWLAGLIEGWRAFDPRPLQARLDGLTHLRVEVGGIAVHLVHAPGTGPDPLPLLLTHGWPSSFLEYLDLLPLLTDPAGHDAAAADAFTVVAPSLPGFGF